MGQTSYTSTSATGAWNTARWNNSADGPSYTSNYTANNAVNFTSGTYTIAGMGASTNVGNVTLGNNVTVNFTTGSTFATNGAVRTFTLGTGSTFDFNGQQISTAAGTGFIISGSGVFATGTYTSTTNAQSFRVDGGTVIARGTTGLGNGSNSSLTLNGGTIASNASRSFDNTRFGAGITIGGDVQFGELAANVALASSTANLSFANNISLGSTTRTLTLGNNGTQTFSGVISNTSGGITFAANSGTSGRFDITNTANTFTGNININGGQARFSADGSLGAAANDIVIDGGRFSVATGFTLGGSRDVFVGDGAGTSIDVVSGTQTINTVIANKSGEIGSFTKLGAGTLTLTNTNTYTGSTTIGAGTLALTGSGSIATSSILRINTSTTLDVTGVTGSFTLGGSQTIEGAGKILATGKTVIATGTLSPGSSPGTFTQDGGTLQLDAGGDLNWQILDATGVAGTGYDTVGLINGATLDLSLLTSLNPYQINLWSLSSAGPDVNGNALNFDDTLDYSWTLFSTGSVISGFNESLFQINSGSFNGTSGFSNPFTGSFGVALADGGTDLVLTYTAIPEPGAALLGGIGILTLLRRRRD